MIGVAPTAEENAEESLASALVCIWVSCQNYGPLLGPLHTRCRIILGTPKETIILTTTDKSHGESSLYTA